MRKNKLLLAIVGLLLGLATPGWAQTDKTSLITNADFEGTYEAYSETTTSNDRSIYQPNGWTVAYSSGNSNDMTALNSDCQQWSSQFASLTQPDNGGKNVYWGRFRWGTGQTLQLSQSIKLSDAGYYTLSADMTHYDGSNGTLVLLAGENTKTVDVATSWSNVSVTFQITQETTIEVGFKATQGAQEQFRFGADNFTLTYYESEDATHKSEYEEALAAAKAALESEDYANVTGTEKTDLQTAIDTYGNVTSGYADAATALTTATSTFTAAAVNYDALIREIAKAKALGVEGTDSYAPTSKTTAATALSNTQTLKVSEYEYVTNNYKYGVELGEWTSKGTNTTAKKFYNEHWSGESNEYMNQNDDNGQGWNASSWSINFNQDVTLPAGNYVFKVAGRMATGDAINMSLVVKNGDTELGSISDFPQGNSARGITTDGKTSFSESDSYANNNNGFGWEWRYVKFTLEEDATVNIAVNAEATALHMWVSFGNYTLQTDDDSNISLIAYNIALNDAKTAIANTEYENVTGDELTALQALVDEDKTLDKETAATIDAQTEKLKTATTTFTDAKTSYDNWATAKATTQEQLPYALSTKYDAITTAQADEPTSATAADEAVEAVTKAIRAYYESNALAEGVEGAENKTSLITNPLATVTDSSDDGYGWTLAQSDGNGTSIGVKSEQSPTNSAGEANYAYFDGGAWNASDWTTRFEQNVEVPAGKYILTVCARASTSLRWFTLRVLPDATDENTYNDVELSKNGASGGVFGGGWDDKTVEFTTTGSNILISVRANTQNQYQWQSFTNFRLVRIGNAEIALDETGTTTDTSIPATGTADVTLTRSFVAGWNSLVLPFDVTVAGLPEAVDEVATFTGDEETDGTIKLDFTTSNDETIPANTPVIVYLTSALDEMTFEQVDVEYDADNAPTLTVAGPNGNFSFVGTYIYYENSVNTSPIENGDYLIKSTGSKKAKGGNGLRAFRAYLDKQTSSSDARVVFSVNGNVVTTIDGITADDENGDIYNLRGQKVNNAQKGVYIKNGKKVVIK